MMELYGRNIWLNIIIISTAVCCVQGQVSDDPCDDSENVIQLPGARRCLAYNNDAKHWVEAASICERRGGTLYRIEEGELRSGLQDCLLSTPNQGGKMDFWIGAVSVWSPQWKWVNGSFLNPMLLCTYSESSLTVKTFDVCSDHLSVDYCVSICRKEGAPFSVIQHGIGRSHPCCWCSYRLDMSQTGSCPETNYTRGPSNRLSVFSSFPRFGSAIVLESYEALAQTETLCARVNLDTTTIRELSSQSCFTSNFYLCNLGNQTEDCTLVLEGQCVFVGQSQVTWFSARADCLARGGDLLIVGELLNMYEIIPYIKLQRNYWIGAYNHEWNFEPGSDVFRRLPLYIADETTCGHMYNEGRTWLWSDSKCDSRKPFYCQYDSIRYADVQVADESAIVCPWEILRPSPVPPVSTSRPIGRSTTARTPVAIAGEESGAFPLAAVIAAAVAALLVLLCILLTIFFTRRRRRKANSKSDRVFAGQRLPKRLYHRWSNSYNYYPDHISDGGWESLSTHHTGVLSDLSVVSAPSPGGHARDRYGHGLTRAYTLASPADLDNLYATPSKKGALLRRSTIKEPHHNFSTLGPSAGGNELHVTSGVTGSGRDDHDLDKTLNSVHETGSPSSKEYMTLAARMNIMEDIGSTRSVSHHRPEVALVTNDVDLNFTVNRAVNKSRVGSENSGERTLDEIEFPVGTTVEIPKSLPEMVLY